MECTECGVDLNWENWYHSDCIQGKHICKHCKNKHASEWQRNHPEEWKKINNASCRKWLKNHPEVNRENSMKFYYENLEICRKYSKAKYYCKVHGIPSPHLRNEFWKDSNVRVARMSNGQFISWKDLN